MSKFDKFRILTVLSTLVFLLLMIFSVDIKIKYYNLTKNKEVAIINLDKKRLENNKIFEDNTVLIKDLDKDKNCIEYKIDNEIRYNCTK